MPGCGFQYGIHFQCSKQNQVSGFVFVKMIRPGVSGQIKDEIEFMNVKITWIDILPDESVRYVKSMVHRLLNALLPRFPSVYRILAHWLSLPEHLIRGNLGEGHARKFLQKSGLRFLAANFLSERGEIDLIFRTDNSEMLVFVEVKTRTNIDPSVNPVTLVRKAQRRRVARAALDYLKLLHNPDVSIRFDVVEVHADDIHGWSCRHTISAFALPPGIEYYPSSQSKLPKWKSDAGIA